MKSAAAVPTVFIIDDDRGMRQSIQDLVESVGLRAESFATSEEFLKRKRTNDPSCLVLDVRLPQMSGLDFQRQLAETGTQIPIIFVTAHGDVPMSVRALKSGAVEFLTKPFRDQDLLDAIHQALQRDRTAQEQQAEIHDLQERYGVSAAPLVNARARAPRSILATIGLKALRDGDRPRARAAFGRAIRVDPYRLKNYLRWMRTWLPHRLAQSLSGASSRRARSDRAYQE